MSESATAGTYEFRGTAEGDITFAISGDPATVTFTRGGVSDTVTDYPATVTSLSLAADEVLTGTAADLSTLVNLNDGVEGAGTVAVTAYDDDTTELVHIFTGLATIAVTGDVILSNPPTSATDHSYTVASGVTLSAAAGVIDGGETVTGTGNVSVDLTANTDLSGVNVSGIVNAVVDPNENIEITGNTNLDAVTQFFVDTDATLTLNVIQGEKPINGTGDFIVKDDAVAIATTTTEGLLDGAASVIVTGTTDTADLSQITAPLIFDTVSVNAGQTLTLTAAQASGKTIGGQGTVEVLALEATPTADLNGITAATVTATASDSVTFTGDTGDAKVIISSGTFELGDTADGNATGTLGASASFEVQSGATLALYHQSIDSIANVADHPANGLNVTGDGTVWATMTVHEIDFSNFADGINLVGFCSTINLSSLTETFTKIDTYLIASNSTFTLNAAQATTKAITDGNNISDVIITDLAADTDLANVDMNGSVTGTATSSVNLTNVDLTKLTALTVDDGADAAIVVTVSPAQYAAWVDSVTLGANDTFVSSDTVAPTSIIASAAFDENTGILTLTGTEFNTILESTETSMTDVKERLDWTKLTWDIDGDDETSPNVTFAESDISSAVVSSDTTLAITLTGTKVAALIGTTDYGVVGGTATADTIDVAEGFIRDLSRNAATTDAVANATLTMTVDDVAPEAPSVTQDGKTLTVTAEAGSTLTILNDAADVTASFTVTEEPAGTFTAVAKEDAYDGSENLSITVTATDLAGNVSAASNAVTGSIDTTAPAAPVITAVATDDIVNAAENTDLVVGGTGEVGATVTLAVTDQTAVVDAQGDWSITVANAATSFGEGAETLSVTQTDAAGNTSEAGTREITVDTVAPTATAFTATATTVGATSNENGMMGLYDSEPTLLTDLPTLLTANTQPTSPWQHKPP